MRGAGAAGAAPPSPAARALEQMGERRARRRSRGRGSDAGACDLSSVRELVAEVDADMHTQMEQVKVGM